MKTARFILFLSAVVGGIAVVNILFIFMNVFVGWQPSFTDILEYLLISSILGFYTYMLFLAGDILRDIWKNKVVQKDHANKFILMGYTLLTVPAIISISLFLLRSLVEQFMYTNQTLAEVFINTYGVVRILDIGATAGIFTINLPTIILGVVLIGLGKVVVRLCELHDEVSLVI